MEIKHLWDFVQMYYPDYAHSDEILHNDILARLAEHDYAEDLDDSAFKMLMSKYEGNPQNPQIKIDFDLSCAYIFEKAIEGYIASIQNSVAIEWDVRDVINCAATNDIDLTETQAKYIIKQLNVKKTSDINIDLTWDGMADHIRNYINEL